MEQITVPKIVFKASRPYLEVLQGAWLKEYPNEKHPSYDEVSDCRDEIEPFWNLRKGETLEILTFITALKWKRTEIPCYLIGRHRASWSDPLTISVTAYREMGDQYFLRVLTHELIHCLFSDNERLFGEGWISIYLDRKYGKENRATKIHILVHAVHAMLHCDYLHGDIKEVKIAKHPDYLKSWEIIEREGGYKKVVSDFVSYVNEKERSGSRL